MEAPGARISSCQWRGGRQETGKAQETVRSKARVWGSHLSWIAGCASVQNHPHLHRWYLRPKPGDERREMSQKGEPHLVSQDSQDW